MKQSISSRFEIKKNLKREVISCRGLVFTQDENQIKITATNVYSHIIRFALYPLWFLLWLAFWLNLLIMLVEKNFAELFIVLFVVFPMAFVLHCILRNKRVFLLNESGVQFFWVISHCRIPWRSIPLQGLLFMEESHHGNRFHPSTMCSCITLYADCCISRFALTTNRDLIRVVSQRLQQRLEELHVKFEIEMAIPPDFAITKRIFISLNMPPMSLQRMNESSWDRDDERGFYDNFYEYAFRYRGETLRDILLLVLWMFTILLAIKSPSVILIVWYDLISLYSALFVRKKWMFFHDKASYQVKGFFASKVIEYPWKDVLSVVITLQPSRKKEFAFSASLPLGHAAWAIVFYNANHEHLLTIEDMKYGDARWLVNQIGQHVYPRMS